MGESRRERIKRFSDVHANARINAKKSQEYMSLELGVSKKTIQNWEKGLSSPSFFQSLEWFRILNMNPFQHYLSIIYPKSECNISDAEVEAEFKLLCENIIPIEDKRALLFLYRGKHGSSPHSLLQLLLAHLHTPLSTRVSQADAISNLYEMHKDLGTLICPDDIQPDLEDLTNARKNARISVLNHDYGYSIIQKE